MDGLSRTLAGGLSLTLAALALAACGSAGTTTTGTTPTTVTPAQESKDLATPSAAAGPNHLPSRTFRVSLTGPGDATPPKPASGSVTVRVIGATGKICWQFSKLVGVVDPLVAYIGQSSSTPTVTFGAHYSAQGCTTDLADMPTILTPPGKLYLGHLYNYSVAVAAQPRPGDRIVALTGPLNS